MSTPAQVIRPNIAQFKALLAAPDDGPVVMLNLLKFKDRAADGASTGGEAYRRYGDAAIEMIEQRGGKVLWTGKAEQVLIGDPAQDWDAVLLVQYPSRAAFVEMTSTKEYGEAHAHREAGLERTIVIACTPSQAQVAGGGA
jgi:uncharacterized protein (DUF1330 family)